MFKAEPAKKVRLSNENKDPNKKGFAEKKSAPFKKGNDSSNKPFGANKSSSEPFKKKFSKDNGKFSNSKSFKRDAPSGSAVTGNSASSKSAETKPVLKKKELKKERRQKKLAENFDLNTNMKKIWETLRR